MAGPENAADRQGDSGPRAARLAEVLLVFLGFLTIYVATRSQYYTGDTFYYAQQVDVWLAEQRKIYMFYHFAHVLVIPIAVFFSLVLKSTLAMDTLASMGVMAAFFGAGTVAVFHHTARLLGLSLKHALLLSAILGFSFGIWDYSTVGEDRIQGLFFCTLFLALFLGSWMRHRDGQALTLRGGLLTGTVLGLCVGTHLSNGILMPFFCLSAVFLFGWSVLKTRYFQASLLVFMALIAFLYLLVAFGNENEVSSLGGFWKLVTSYHSEEQPYFFRDTGLRAGFLQIAKAGIGFFTAFYYMPEAYFRTSQEFSSWPVRVLLSAGFLLFLAAFFSVILRSPIRKMDICLWILACLWGLHSLLFEPISRADWFPILVITLLLFAGVWNRVLNPAVPDPGRRRPRWVQAYLPVFLLSLVLNNGPQMVKFHREKSLYIQFAEFCREHLPKGSLLVEGNSMAITSLDYFQDRDPYPFHVVTFFDVMGSNPAIFSRLKPPPQPIREIDGALASGRPVFITKRTLQIFPEQERFLEMEYSQEVIDRFLERYAIEPFLQHPYSDLYRVFLKRSTSVATDPDG